MSESIFISNQNDTPAHTLPQRDKKPLAVREPSAIIKPPTAKGLSANEKPSINKTSVINAIANNNCFHCGLDIPAYSKFYITVNTERHQVCCPGCMAAVEFIQQQGLSDFYQHRGEQLPFIAARKVSDIQDGSPWQDYDKATISTRYIRLDNSKNRVQTSIYIQGMYCSSCAWLIDRALRSLAPDIAINLNPNTRRLNLEWSLESTDQAAPSASSVKVKFSDILSTIASLGYQPRPIEYHSQSSDETHHKLDAYEHENHAALKRLAVAGFGMMQVMTYAIGLYFGDFQGIDPQLRHFLNSISLLLATWVVFYAGYPFFRHAWFDLRNRHLGMDVPVAIAIGGAYSASVVSVLSGSDKNIYFDSAVMFVFFLSLGRFLEMRARYQSGSDEDALRQMLPPLITVERQQDHQWNTLAIEPQQIQRQDRIKLNVGETIPFDGKVLSGSARVDQSFLTGEAKPILVETKDNVTAGSIIRSGHLFLSATHNWQNSTIASIKRLLDKTQAGQPQQLLLADKLVRYFIGTLLVLATVTAFFWVGYQPERAFAVTLAVLVASCPCAFALATPVVTTVASHVLSKQGILLANYTALDKLLTVNHWCFDKTGTLSQGQMSLEKIITYNEADVQDCLQLIAALERNVDHVLSAALTQTPTSFVAKNVFHSNGNGLCGTIDGTNYYLGKSDWVYTNAQIKTLQPEEHSDRRYTRVTLAREGLLLADVYLRDQIRNDAEPFMYWLKAQSSVGMSVLSGDRQSVVDDFCDELPLVDALGDLLPNDKLKQIAKMQQDGAIIAMVGDGINDAPVLSQADVSIAMANGSELSQSQADIIVLGGRLSNLQSAIQIAQKAQRIIKQNFFWAIAYNLTVLPLAMSGMLAPWLAAIGMSLSSLLVVLNGRRLKRQNNQRTIDTRQEYSNHCYFL